MRRVLFSLCATICKPATLGGLFFGLSPVLSLPLAFAHTHTHTLAWIYMCYKDVLELGIKVHSLSRWLLHMLGVLLILVSDSGAIIEYPVSEALHTQHSNSNMNIVNAQPVYFITFRKHCFVLCSKRWKKRHASRYKKSRRQKKVYTQLTSNPYSYDIWLYSLNVCTAKQQQQQQQPQQNILYIHIVYKVG